MGLFNWLSWQLERRTLKQQIDRLMTGINELAQEAAGLRTRLAKTGMLLHEAQNGAKLAAEEQDKLKTELELHKSAAAYWEGMAKDQQKRISELRRPAGEYTSVTESIEPAETELERKAWEIYASNTYSVKDSFKFAEQFLAERDSRRKKAEVTSEN